MICRKCGAILPDDAIRCSNCGIKVNMVCPECKSLTPFGERYCHSCGFEIIKICQVCHSSNAYYSDTCRKCSAPLTQTQNITSQNAQKYATETVAPISTASTEVYYSDLPVTSNVDSQLENEEKISDDSISEQKADNLKNDNKNTEKNIESEYTSDKIGEINYSPTVVEEDILQEFSSDITIEEPTAEIPITDEKIENIEPQKKYYDNDDDYISAQEPEVEQTTEEEQETQEEEKKEEGEEEPIQDEYRPVIKSETVINLIQNVKSSINKHIIAITGPEGCGKSAVLQQTRNILNNDGYMCLFGGCSPLSQITSFGFFQDAFLRLLGFPPYRNGIESFMKDFKKSTFYDAFNFLDSQELALFLNLLYPVQKDNFENILENKQLMFSIIEKIIKTFLTNTNMVIIIDNFELLDGASYDFINYIAGRNFFNNRLKLIVAYQEDRPIQSYFEQPKSDEIFETIKIEKFSSEELPSVMVNTIGIDISNIISDEYVQTIVNRADGDAIRLEQELAHLFDINYLAFSENDMLVNPESKSSDEPATLEELIKLRLNTLPAEVKNVLYMSAILGYRFATDILCHSAPMPAKKAFNILELLKNELFIKPVDEFTFEFKSLAIWKLIYKEAQSDLLFKENSERLYNVLKTRVLSSNIQKLISCSEALNKKEEFDIWQDTASITAKLGDTNLYVIAQKQCLKIFEEQDMPNSDKIKEIIYEQIGKLLSKKSPAEAVGYLANALDTKIKVSDTNKIIDLSGYFINSCYLTGNYFGVVEAVDAIISNLETTDSKVSDIQLALIKTRKLEALLHIGNTEQIINLIKEDILIKINEEVNQQQTDKGYKNLITEAWLVSNTILAKAYAIQGNQEVFAVNALIKEFIENNNYKTQYFSTKVSLIEALAHTLIGETSISNQILITIKNEYENKKLDKKLLCEWNMINVINRVLEYNFEGLKEELFELAEFANNINEHSVKNLVKLILGHLVKEEGNISKAISIYNDEVTYFAKEKIAFGAMLSWALITRANIDLGDVDMALNTATKALEVAKGPKINNAFFIIYFQKLIAECYLLKGDLIAVKMYLEKALLLAKQENLKYLLVFLYLDYGKYMEEYMNAKQTFSPEYVKLTTDTYNKAYSFARETKISRLKDITTKARSSFRTFCQLNSIEV